MSPIVLAPLLLTFAVFTYEAQSVQTTNILDLIYWDINKPVTGGVEIRNDASEQAHIEDHNAGQDDEPSPKTCQCAGPSCLCCVDFNITYIDLGGPGCVSMRYVSKSEGISVNVSYGDSVLQSAQIRSGPNPEPACIALLGSLAQVCARFATLETLDDGLKGCLLLEPKLLGEIMSRVLLFLPHHLCDIQTQFSIGCFNMDPNGMRVDAATNFTNEIVDPLNGSDVSNLSEDDILTAVQESAEQGLAFFENLFALSFDNNNKKDNVTKHPNNAAENIEPSLEIKTSERDKY